MQPPVRTASPHEAVVWLNYTRFPVRISLAGEAATRIRCREPAHFRKSEAGRLSSPAIPPLGSASLCLLDPGVYSYVVEELDAASSSLKPVLGGRRFEGELRIIAEDRARTDADTASLARFHQAQADLYLALAEVREELAATYAADGLGEAARRQRLRAEEARRAAAEHRREAERYRGASRGSQ